jgi:hypothetical protein
MQPYGPVNWNHLDGLQDKVANSDRMRYDDRQNYILFFTENSCSVGKKKRNHTIDVKSIQAN